MNRLQVANDCLGIFATRVCRCRRRRRRRWGLEKKDRAVRNCENHPCRHASARNIYFASTHIQSQTRATPKKYQNEQTIVCERASPTQREILRAKVDGEVHHLLLPYNYKLARGVWLASYKYKGAHEITLVKQTILYPHN